MVDKSSEHLYKSKLKIIATECRYLTRSELFSHSDWGRIRWENMSAKPLPEEPATEDAGTNNRRGVRHEERHDERWRDCQSPAVGHGRSGEIQGDHGRPLSESSWLPDSVRYHEQKDVPEPEVLADDAARLRRAGHLHHARRQQT